MAPQDWMASGAWIGSISHASTAGLNAFMMAWSPGGNRYFARACGKSATEIQTFLASFLQKRRLFSPSRCLRDCVPTLLWPQA
jgi:hypothetical protein